MNWPHREKAGVISEEPVWVWWDIPFVYMSGSLLGLMWVVITEWRDEKHLGM